MRLAGKTKLASSLVVGLLFVATRANAVTVVASPTFPDSLSDVETLRKIYLGKMHRGTAGVTLTPIDQPETGSLWREFSEKVLLKTPLQLKAYWNQRIYSGRGVPPLIRKNDESVVEFVLSTPNAVGYISDSAATAKVKVIFKAP